VKASLARQSAFPSLCPIAEAVNRLASEGGVEERGAVNTKREIVDFILDLTGYTPDAPLTEYRLLEPSFGDGDFLLEAVERLLKSAALGGLLSFNNLAPAIRAVELHRTTYERTQGRVSDLLRKSGIPEADVVHLCTTWLHQGDFLLTEFAHDFSHVVGNPPYVRQESIPDVLITEYRSRYKTIYDRADIYVPFIERSLGALSLEGKLGFICADRWMKNKYGRKLRELVSKKFSLTAYIDMYGADAFHTEVSAYPAITLIERTKTNKTRVFARPTVDAGFLRSLATELTATELSKDSQAREIEDVAKGSEPWVLDSFEELALVRRLESQFPTIEETGCKVGIGVATGADKAFIAEFDSLDVEASRKLPLAMTRDIRDGRVKWRGMGIVNPFADDGKLVDLERFPRLRAYLEDRRDQIAGRHVAKKNPRGWYRTIDRIYPELTYREKLLIPDIKGDASIVYEEGKLFPHHNLYYIVSDEWDIHALQAVMRSGIARLFVSLYSTRMRGGYLRFQAQYLRKIRLPKWQDVSIGMRERLAICSQAIDNSLLNEAVSELYGLNAEELKLIQGKTEK
jgi:hypothetical protein